MRLMICSRGERSEQQYISQIVNMGIGVELQGYGLKGVQSISNWQTVFQLHSEFRQKFHGALAIHGPFIGVSYCHDDHLFKAAVQARMDKTFDLVEQLKAEKVIFHSAMHSDVPKFDIYDEWIQGTIDFWKKEIERYEHLGVTVVLENIVDTTPDFLMKVHDGVNHPNLKICLDVGHVNVWASSSMEVWIKKLNSRIAHVHLHNNDGLKDQHRDLLDGSVDFDATLDLLKKHCPNADLSLEVLGSAEQKLVTINTLNLLDRL